MRIKRFLAFFLAILMILPIVAAALPVQAEGEYVRYKTLSAVDLLTLMIGTSPSAEEKAYLEQSYGESTVYNAAIPGELITVSGGTASAAGYTTATTAGSTITWSQSGSVLMSAGVAQATYRGALTVPKNDANRLLNYAYNRAVEAMEAEADIIDYEEYVTYLALKSEYDQAKIAYDNYLLKKKQYDLNYDRYLKNKKAWDDYNAYVAAKAEYDAAMVVYNNAVTAYKESLVTYGQQKDAYDLAVNDYKAYVKNKEKIDAVLTPIESMFIIYGMWNGTEYGMGAEVGVRSLYEALQNEDLVSMLMQYQDKLCASTSLTKAEFQSLKATSDELNVLLQAYAAKRETDPKGAFLFYQANYASILEKFNRLYDRLMVIMKPSVYTLMCAAIDEEYEGGMAGYKKWRIKNVLCQIYVVSTCMDDKDTLTAKWKFYADDGEEKEYLYGNLINQNQILYDSNAASPAGLVWVDEPYVPAEPVAPTEPTEPTKPTQVTKPTATVSEPVPPAFVAEPIPPAEVSKVSKPSNEMYDMVRDRASLISAFKVGRIVRRRAYTADATVYLSETVARRYDPATGAPILSVYNEKGELSEESAVAERWSDSARTYVLLGFKPSADGLCYYPVYEAAENVFEIVFRSEGVELSRKNYAYGQTPKTPSNPTKAPTNTKTYTFDGWDPPVSVVKENATYTARFKEQDRYYTVTFRYRIEQSGGVVEVSETKNYLWGATLSVPATVEDYIEDLYWYSFTGWDKTVTAVNGNVTYTALYSKTSLIGGDPEEPPTTEPPTTEPPTTEPAVTYPAQTEPVVTYPAQTEPVVTYPAQTEPVVTYPAQTEPVVTYPAQTEPVVTYPVVTQPVTTQPSETSGGSVSETETATETETETDEDHQNSDGLAYTQKPDGTWEVSGIGDCTLTKLVIPSTYMGAAVTSIGESAFRNQTQLTRVGIPDTVTSIGANAFFGCTGLKMAEIPRSVTSIGTLAFGNCSALYSATVEEGNPVYHSDAGCIIETASGVLILGQKWSVIPTDGSVRAIGAYAFYGCSKLSTIRIPRSVTSIGEGAFGRCSFLSRVDYEGSADEWAGVTVASGNEKLLGANIAYEAPNQPVVPVVPPPVDTEDEENDSEELTPEESFSADTAPPEESTSEESDPAVSDSDEDVREPDGSDGAESGSHQTEAETETEIETEPEGPKIELADDGVFVSYSGSDVTGCKGLITLANLKKLPLSVSFRTERIQWEADPTVLGELIADNVDRISLIRDGQGISIAFFNQSGERVYPDDGYMTLSIPAEAVADGCVRLVRRLADGSREIMDDVLLTDGFFTFEADSRSSYGTAVFYRVTVKIGDKETVYEREAGEWIPLTVSPPLNHRVDPFLLFRDGQTEGTVLERLDGFTMPAYNGTLTVSFSEILYRIEFRYRGGSLVKEYRYGETITPPKIDLNVIEDGICYTFIGWSESVGVATEDKIFEARYEVISEEEATDKGEGGAMRGVLRYWILPLAGIALGVIALVTAGIILTVKLVRRNKKNKEQRR